MMKYFWTFWVAVHGLLMIVAFAQGVAGPMILIAVADFLGSIIYMLPTIVAESRGVANVAPCFVVNFFLGWTLIGWVAAFVLALSGETSADIAKKQADQMESVARGVEMAFASRGTP
jgi:hypothetical protein